MIRQFICEYVTDKTIGKILRKKEKSGALYDEYTYSYDEAGHLTEVMRNDLLAESYNYNDLGQRIRKTNGWADGMVKYGYDERGCLAAAGTRLFDYDERGNLARCRDLSKYPEEKVTHYFYHETLLRGVVLPGGIEIVYTYDAHGNNPVCPVRKYKNGKPVMEYVWRDIRHLASCVDRERGIRFNFAYKNGVLASVSRSRAGGGKGEDILSRLGESGVLLAFCDQVGTPKLFTSKAGRHIKALRYDSFGVLEDDTLPELFIPVGFAGGLLDEDTGFVRFGFRDYDPGIGRFTCPDPLGDTGGDHDLYDYCVDDPVNKFDPLGLFDFGLFMEQQGVREGASRGLHEMRPKESDVKQEPSTPEYIEVKKRPLDAPLGNVLYNNPTKEWHHRHAIGNNGYNKGFAPEGFVSESSSSLKRYVPYDGIKYNGPLMREALEQVEAEKKMESAVQKLDVGDMFDRLSHIPGFDDNINRQQAEEMAGGIYFVNKYDCRGYMNEAVKRAKKLGEERGISPYYKK